MTQPNILLIMSDQHHPRITGYRGHPHVQTPHLDRLAGEGAHFMRAYCTNPICTPSRMSMLTGQYTHRIGVPNNGFPLDREIMTWPRRLDQAGIETTMLGKLDLCGDYQDAGFTQHRIIRRRPVHPAMSAEPPYHLQAPFQERLPDAYRSWRPVSRALRHAGPRTGQILCREQFITNEVDGENDDFLGNYDHDLIVTDWAVDYLREKGAAARTGEAASWALYVGLIMPHEPFTVPADYFDRYYPDNLALSIDARFPNPDLPPALQFLQRAHGTGTPTEEDLRRTIAAYYGMITCVDDQVGRLLEELDRQGLADDTLVLYTSDHGESLGEHGLFFKKCSYEGAAGIPLVMRGPGVPAGAHVDVPVDLTDLYPTMLDAAGLAPDPALPGASWLPLVRGERPPARDFAFAEYHGYFVNRDWFLIVHDGLKYTWYSNGDAPTLFDLARDPHELHDVAADPAYAAGLQACHARLLAVCDPAAESYRAKALQGLIGPGGEDLTDLPAGAGCNADPTPSPSP
jgi:choline-sulfatase